MDGGSAQNGSSAQSMVTRLYVSAKDWLLALPFITRCVLLLCIAVYIYDVLFPVYQATVCWSAQYVFVHFQIWRIFSHTVFHNGLLHLAMNMSALAGIAPRIEREMMGSLQLAWFFIVIIIVCSLSSGVLLFIWSLLASKSPWWSCSVGLSGVLFALMTVYCALVTNPIPFLRVTSVPPRVYPWLMLCLMQVIIPNASFVGHLSGLIVGNLYILGFLNRIMLSPLVLNNVETSNCWGHVMSMPGYIVNPNLGLPTVNGAITLNPMTWWSSIRASMQTSQADVETSSQQGPGTTPLPSLRPAPSPSLSSSASSTPFAGQPRKIGTTSEDAATSDRPIHPLVERLESTPSDSSAPV